MRATISTAIALMCGIFIGTLLNSSRGQEPAAVDRDSRAYKLGYADGRWDGYVVSTGLTFFGDCIRYQRERTPEQCWDDQIAATKTRQKLWDELTVEQRIEKMTDYQGMRWVKNLRGEGDPKDLPRYLR
jgi:hypothetical protein